MDAPDYEQDIGIVHVATHMTADIAPSAQMDRYAKDYVPGFIPEVWREFGQPDESIPELLQLASLRSFEMLRIVNPNALSIL